ncbi:hypothetical protein GCM10007857_55830 [Bradyrhizobium iriomotense]|uniref:Uncharacterized protein n=1 Tax=Bradyrhizobium iriomotense TaxID=441950 RepID=A0ABQ6B7G3_9BRAD|nr:hypothetical protein GCM10007857_55830 [Bradyrhizobium iriomotense]
MTLDMGRLPNLKGPPQRRKCYQIREFTGTIMKELADGGLGHAIPKVAYVSDVLAECPLGGILDILAVGQPRPIYPQLQTYRCTAPTEEMGQQATTSYGSRPIAYSKDVQKARSFRDEHAALASS